MMTQKKTLLGLIFVIVATVALSVAVCPVLRPHFLFSEKTGIALPMPDARCPMRRNRRPWRARLMTGGCRPPRAVVLMMHRCRYSPATPHLIRGYRLFPATLRMICGYHRLPTTAYPADGCYRPAKTIL
ncbi:hypothetical protein [Sodalis sp. (in: enterobacteria)]|uniref:hypothetical protein n=1 Tax=Sodalis sp. (in: enterobacteria) TaxID=1898979 RepID=UPI003F377D3B